MLQRNPELSLDSGYFVSHPLQHSEQSDSLSDDEKKYLDKLHKKQRRKRRVGSFALGLAFVTNGAYWADVHHNIAIENDAEPGIAMIAPPLDEKNDDTALIVFNGFNTVNADYFSQINSEALQQNGDGYVLSIQYNNASFDGETFFKTVDTYLEDHDIDKANFAYVSMGNIPGSKVGADLALNTDIDVGPIQHYMSPSGSNGVEQLRKDEMSFAGFAAEWIPGSANSTFWRIAVEQYFYNNEYTKGEFNGDFGHDLDIVAQNAVRFIKVGSGILTRFNNGDYTSNSFLLKQIDALNNADLEENYKIIGEESDDAYLLYWRGKYDDIVNQDISTSQLRDYANAGNMAWAEYEIPDASHTAYWKTTEQFKQTAALAAEEMPSTIYEHDHRYSKFITQDILNGEYITATEPDSSEE